MCIVSKISGNETNSPSDFPILADAMRINNAYTNAGTKRIGETTAPRISDEATPITVNGGARYL
jgi:hypothetical protein